MTEKIIRTDAEWRQLLTPEQYAVTRKHATERAFTGEYVHNNQDGAYVCVACGQPLFSSKTKFDSGSGWPSFWDMLEQGSVLLKDDNSFFMHRVEVLCARCESHLGHLFDDGHAPPANVTASTPLPWFSRKIKTQNRF